MHELEAELYKIKSKYVILLKESQEPELGEEVGVASRKGVWHGGCGIEKAWGCG